MPSAGPRVREDRGSRSDIPDGGLRPENERGWKQPLGGQTGAFPVPSRPGTATAHRRSRITPTGRTRPGVPTAGTYALISPDGLLHFHEGVPGTPVRIGGLPRTTPSTFSIQHAGWGGPGLRPHRRR
ncbi:SPFH domain containing protein [Streptomyces laurentii]|uniref:SPFH domain containing protein n=1 Tax=Streptomyces laurentii TaxID=39478 RepID=A0A160P1Q4_STRLU|nr:SPFH domain containing protein [Streptomyces laurentii]